MTTQTYRQISHKKMNMISGQRFISCPSSWLKTTLGLRKFQRLDQSRPRWSFRRIANNRWIGTNRTLRIKTTITLTSTCSSLFQNIITSRCPVCTKHRVAGSSPVKILQSPPGWLMSKFSQHRWVIMTSRQKLPSSKTRITAEGAEAKSASLSSWVRRNGRRWMKSLIGLTCPSRFALRPKWILIKSRGNLLSIRQSAHRIRWPCLRQRPRRLRRWRDTNRKKITNSLALLTHQDSHKSRKYRSWWGNITDMTIRIFTEMLTMMMKIHTFSRSTASDSLPVRATSSASLGKF